MAYIKVKGKTYGIHTGSRGGRYWIDDNGKKHYLKSETSKPKKEESKKEVKKVTELPKLKRWIGRFTEDIGGDHDGFSEWCEAYTESEAREEFKDRYRHNSKVELDYVYEDK